MSTDPSSPSFTFSCTHRTRHTLAVGAMLLIVILALTAGLALAAHVAVEALTGATPDPNLFTLSVLVAGPLTAAAAAPPAALALITGVLARTTIVRTDSPDIHSLNCTATYRSQLGRLFGAFLLTVPTIGMSWLYFAPLLLARTLETAAPVPGASFRYHGSRTRLFVIATTTAVIITVANVILQNTLIPALTPFNPDTFANTTPTGANGPQATPLGTFTTICILLIFVTGTTLAATWYLTRHVLANMRVTFPDSAADLTLAPVPDTAGHVRYVLFWMILVLSTLGLALPCAYTSVLKRLLNSTRSSPALSPAT